MIEGWLRFQILGFLQFSVIQFFLGRKGDGALGGGAKLVIFKIQNLEWTALMGLPNSHCQGCQISSSMKAHLLSKVVYHGRVSFIELCFPSKVLINQRSSTIKCGLPSKIVSFPSREVFHKRSSSIKGLLFSSIKGCVPSS